MRLNYSTIKKTNSSIEKVDEIIWFCNHNLNLSLIQPFSEEYKAAKEGDTEEEMSQTF